MSNLPEWTIRLIAGLAKYDDEHPKLFATYAGSPDYRAADCCCHLLNLVPADIQAYARGFAAGLDKARETADDLGGPQCVCPRIAVHGAGEPPRFVLGLAPQGCPEHHGRATRTEARDETHVAEEFALLEELRRKSNVNWARQPEPRPDTVHIAGYQPAPSSPEETAP